MREHNWKIGQPLTLRSPTDARLTLRFIPVLELRQSYLSRMFFFDRRLLDDAVKKLFGADIQDLASFLVVRVDQAGNMGLVMTQIDESFHNSESETETVTESDSIGNFVTAIGDVRPIIYSMCVVVVLTILLIAANSMAMMVRDRIGDVALMRALGFARGHVAILLLCEAVLIGVTGAVIGAALALWCFSQGLSLGAITGAYGYMEVRLETALSAIAVALLVSVASAIVPIINAARIQPAIAIRKTV
jgi:putative ABC transport system permease protein